MSLFVEGTNIRPVFDHAMLAIQKASRDGVILMVNEEAKEIFHQHPNCGMTLAELREWIAWRAAQDRVPIQLG